MMRLAKKLRLWVACMSFGASYGAVCGAAVGTLAIPVLGTLGGALIGAICGAVCGAVAGITGSLVGARWGWGVAGLLGGLTPMFLLPGLSDLGEGGLALIAVVTAPVGALLGWALSFALCFGSSPVPGVRKLAAIIHDAAPAPRMGGPHPYSTEVSPSTAPEGRGDE